MTVRNPFPGMNPFLEQRWQDFHSSFITALKAALNESLPADLVARTETDLYVTADRYERPITPDVHVVDFGLPGVEGDTSTGDGGGTLIAVAPRPVKVRMRAGPARVNRIEIRESGGDSRVVTAIELFSPTNKVDRRGRQQYERKREEYLSAGVSLVEIDLLRSGPHLVAAPPEIIPPEVRKTYKVCVVRRPEDELSVDEAAFELYGANLDEPLPPIFVPLRPTDADVTLDLQTALDAAFRQGKYIDLRYDREPEPPFTDDEQRVVRQRLGALAKGPAHPK